MFCNGAADRTWNAPLAPARASAARLQLRFQNRLRQIGLDELQKSRLLAAIEPYDRGRVLVLLRAEIAERP